MSLTPGCAIRIHPQHLENCDHTKYAICATSCHCFYFYINTSPNRSAEDAQVFILGSTELPPLKYTSYIDTSQLHEIPPRAAQHADENGEKWQLPQAVIKRIRKAVASSRHLTPIQIETVLQELQT